MSATDSCDNARSRAAWAGNIRGGDFIQSTRAESSTVLCTTVPIGARTVRRSQMATWTGPWREAPGHADWWLSAAGQQASTATHARCCQVSGHGVVHIDTRHGRLSARAVGEQASRSRGRGPPARAAVVSRPRRPARGRGDARARRGRARCDRGRAWARCSDRRPSSAMRGVVTCGQSLRARSTRTSWMRIARQTSAQGTHTVMAGLPVSASTRAPPARA